MFKEPIHVISLGAGVQSSTMAMQIGLMESVQSITLGKPPAGPDEPDERVANAMKIRERGFPDGVIAICKCNRVLEFGLDEAAVMLVDHTWPICCGKKMIMEDPANAPQF